MHRADPLVDPYRDCSLEADAAKDDLAAEVAGQKTATVTAFERKRPARKPFPEHLPRERLCRRHAFAHRVVPRLPPRRSLQRNRPLRCDRDNFTPSYAGTEHLTLVKSQPEK